MCVCTCTVSFCTVYDNNEGKKVCVCLSVCLSVCFCVYVIMFVCVCVYVITYFFLPSVLICTSREKVLADNLIMFLLFLIVNKLTMGDKYTCMLQLLSALLFFHLIDIFRNRVSITLSGQSVKVISVLYTFFQWMFGLFYYLQVL